MYDVTPSDDVHVIGDDDPSSATNTTNASRRSIPHPIATKHFRKVEMVIINGAAIANSSHSHPR